MRPRLDLRARSLESISLRAHNPEITTNFEHRRRHLLKIDCTQQPNHALLFKNFSTCSQRLSLFLICTTIGCHETGMTQESNKFPLPCVRCPRPRSILRTHTRRSSKVSAQLETSLTAHHETSKLNPDRAQRGSRTSFHDLSDAVTPPNR